METIQHEQKIEDKSILGIIRPNSGKDMANILFALLTITLSGIMIMLFTNDKLLPLIKDSKNKGLSVYTAPIEVSSLKVKDEDISSTYLTDATIDKIKIHKVNASGVHWKNITVKGGVISESVFRKAHLENVIFENVEVTNSNFAGSVLKNVTFKNCKLIDGRGLHNFGQSFNGLKDSNILLENSEIRGILFGFSEGAFTLKGVKGQYVLLGALENNSKIEIEDSEIEWLIGDNSELSILNIHNSTFADSKLNNITAQTVKLNNLMGQLSVTGNLGDVEVTRLNTEPDNALFMGNSTISNIKVSNCKADTELNLMKSTITSFSIQNCKLRELWLLKGKYLNLTIQSSEFDIVKVYESISKSLNIKNLTIYKELSGNLAQADEYTIEEITINPAATIEVEDSNISWKPFSTNKN
jgi:hypothetical protein